MKAAPVINCVDEACLRARWKQSGEIGVREVHFDISDGVFAPSTTACTPELLRELLSENPEIEVEVHLMIQDPESHIDAWLEAGVKKIIVHIEAIRDFQSLLNRVRAHHAELILGIKMETDVKELSFYLPKCPVHAVHLLEVPAGPSGSTMNQRAVDRIRFVRTLDPDVTISVDGGVTKETAREVCEAGADRVVSSSFIWNSASPKETYELLLGLGS